MLSFILLLQIALNFFSPENFVTMIVGGLVSLGATHWIKKQTGAMGAGAMLIALFVSIAVAVVAVLISLTLTGGFSWDQLGASAIQIFAVATIAYKTLMADR